MAASFHVGDLRLPSRFWEKVFVDERGCWLWTGAIGKNGYGNTTIGRKIIYVHRATMLHLKGEAPIGLVCDHLCRVRHCCNPDHLEFVTNAENGRRGLVKDAARARARRVTSCPQGHPYDADNTYADRHGWRSCKTCRAANLRRYRAERRVAQ
jgi:hypothetical protein